MKKHKSLEAVTHTHTHTHTHTQVKSKRGITLIALVITIIVLLILAGVTISLVLNGGILDQAKNATEATKIASAKEELELRIADEQMKAISQGKSLSKAELLGILNGSNINGEAIRAFDGKIRYKGYEFAVADNLGLADGTILTLQDGYTAIETIQDLKDIQNNPGGTYMLMADIDFSGQPNWTSICRYNGDEYEETSVTGFYGTLDGNGYAIKNLTGQPLFTYLTGTIQNLSLENVNINGNGSIADEPGEDIIVINNCNVSGTISGTGYTGGFIGGAGLGYNCYITIENCYSTAKVESTSMAGGLTGGAQSITIKNSYSTGGIKAGEAGGLVGVVGTAIIENSFSTGKVEGTYTGGGLIAVLPGNANITNSYSISQITGSHNKGGLIGDDSSGGAGTITNSYYCGEITGAVTNSRGTRIATKALMKLQSTYSGWNFTTIWGMETGTPFLDGLPKPSSVNI